MENEEEKRVLKLLEEISNIESCTTGDDFTERDAQIILNLINKQNKVIDLMYQDIECEYMGTDYMDTYSIENYYKQVEEEND